MLLKPGFFADETIFNHDTIIDLATFGRPKQKSLGVEQVIVNGKTAWIGGEMCWRRPGQSSRASCW